MVQDLWIQHSFLGLLQETVVTGGAFYADLCFKQDFREIYISTPWILNIWQHKIFIDKNFPFDTDP